MALIIVLLLVLPIAFIILYPLLVVLISPFVAIKMGVDKRRERKADEIITRAVFREAVRQEEMKQFRQNEEKAYLESIIDRNNQIIGTLDRQLEECEDSNKRTVILSKMNALDTKTFNVRRKLAKLIDDE